MKRYILVALSVMALASCSSIDKRNINKNEQSKINEQVKNVSKQINLIPLKSVEDKRIEAYMDSLRVERQQISEDEAKKLIDEIDESDFKLFAIDKFYKGEKINLDIELTDGLSAIGIEAQNPSVIIKADHKDFDKIESKKDKYEVELLADGSKKITYLDQNRIFVTFRDDKSNKTRKIMFKKAVKVIDKLPEIKDGIRYEELKKGADNGRVKYEVVSYGIGELEGYEDDVLRTKNEEKRAIPFSSYFALDKYKDMDDFVGVKKVKVKKYVDGKEAEIVTKMVDFGKKLSDFSNDYDKLLLNLDKTTLKFSEDGKSIEGGFNPDLVDMLTRYEKKATGKDNNLEFVTEILDKDKNVGEHNIVRKIVKDGVVIFEKKEKAYVAFPGTTVGIADSSFYEVSPEVEARMIRQNIKALDSTQDDTNDPLELDRQHGTNVIGAMIDEVAIGNSNYINNLINGGAKMKMLVLAGLDRKTYGTGKEFDDSKILKAIKVQYLQFNRAGSALYGESEVFFEKLKELTEIIKEGDQFIEETDKITDDKKRNEEYIKYYNKMLKALELTVSIPEKDKLLSTDLHFSSIALENSKTKRLNTGRNKKYLNKMLEENKNIKAVNFSYGSGRTVEDYLAIKNMTQEEKQRAVDEYNNNPDFKAAVLIYLHKLDYKDLEYTKEFVPGSVGIPSMTKYFMSRDKITVADYQKLLDLELLITEKFLKDSSEFMAANQDVLFVFAAGNSRNNSGQTDADLTSFDEYGRKVIYKDGDKLYNSSTLSFPTYVNEKEKEKAKKEGRDPKYKYSYRKNLLGAIGLSSKYLTTGINATDNISETLALNTSDAKIYAKLGIYAYSQQQKLLVLQSELLRINQNPSKYPEEYKKNIEVLIQSIKNLSKLEKYDLNGRPLLTSYTRAGKSKLWMVATEGQVTHAKELTEEEMKLMEKPESYDDNKFVASKPFISGSSFAAPRVTAIAGEIGTKYPWMTAQQIKQTILTTADDDARIRQVKNTTTGVVTRERVGIYGVDENIGWGIVNKQRAYNGPARFVRALTREVGQEDFVADIPYGAYDFKNDIEGKFDVLQHMLTRNKLNEVEFTILHSIKDYDMEYVLSDEFNTNPETKPIADLFEKSGISKMTIYEKLYPRVNDYLDSLDTEERELFEDAGLIKKGKGLLALSGLNTYKDPTVVEEGTLVLRGTGKSPIVVHKNAKLKLDQAKSTIENLMFDENFVAKQDAEVINAGTVYSLSAFDNITKTFTPLEGSKILVGANAKLTLADLDLSEVTNFNLDVFKRKGMNVFKKPELFDPYDNIKLPDIKDFISKDHFTRTLVEVKKVSKKDLYKIKLGKFKYTEFVDLVFETEDKKDDKENVVLKVKLVRKDSSSTNRSAYSLADVLTDLEKRRKNASGKEADKLDTLIDNILLTSEAEAKALDGELLTNSQVIGFELTELKNDAIKNNLNSKMNKDFAVFVNSINGIKIPSKKNIKSTVLNNGMLVGMNFKSKYNVSGVSASYINSIFNNYDILLKEIPANLPIRNDLTPEEVEKEKARREIRTYKGKVLANTLGLDIFNKFNYNNGLLTTIASLNYISKTTERKINDRETAEANSSDFIFNLNVEGGYKFKINDRISLTPIIGSYIRYESTV